MTKYYKSLTADHIGPYSAFDFTPYLPKGKRPGKWLPKVERLEMCKSGWHCVTAEHLLDWLNAEVYEVEIQGKKLEDDKITAQKMRLVKLVMTDKEMRLLACDYAEHVLPIFEKVFPDDKRPRNAIEVSRKYAYGKATKEELDAARDAAGDAARAAGAAWAAGDAAGDAAGVAAGAAWAARVAAGDAAGAAWAARVAERKWQIKRLKYYLARSK